MYVKFFVSISSSEQAESAGTSNPTRNAFDIESSVSLSTPDTPCRVSARNRKDDLYNAIIDMFEEKNLVLPRSDANSVPSLIKQSYD